MGITSRNKKILKHVEIIVSFDLGGCETFAMLKNIGRGC